MGALFRLFRYLRNYRGAMIMSFILLAISVGFQVVQPKLIEWAIDYGIRPEEARYVTLGALGILVTALIATAFNVLSGYQLIRASQGMAYEMWNDLYRTVMSFSFSNLDHWRTGELLVRMSSDVNTVRMFCRMGVFAIVRSVVMIVGSIVIMFLTNARLARILAIIMPCTMVLFFFVAAKIRPLFTKVREALDKLNNVLQENLAGAKIIRAFARQPHEIKRFERSNRGLLAVSLKVGYIVSMLFPFLFFVGNMALLATLWAGGRAVAEAIVANSGTGLTLGQLIAFNNYAINAMFPILMLGFVLSSVSMASASAVRIEMLMTEEPSIQERSDAVSFDRLKGKIEFRNVCFRYGEGEDAVKGVSIVISPGEKIGVIGATGSGKSSFASLIPRFYDANSGEILIDDTDMRDLALPTLRTRVAVVLQETFLFSGTIRENVLFGKHDASQDEMEQAAAVACAREFIEEKESGWDEHVGERGMGLSGGQRQRVAIARAVISDPDIIILDDVTSSVDLATERRLIKNLYEKLSGKTSIIISQKINSVKNADRILLFQDGRIVAAGNHDELLASNETYREIHETQSSQIQA